MELTELVFTARTEELERASKVIGGLATDLSNLNKVSKEVAQTEATLAKAAKANADANLQNAKAQDVRLKSTIAADKADQSTEKSVKKSTEATERHTRAVKANADILAYQTDRAKFMAEGFSSGNASTLAQAKAVGQLSDELKKILDLQRSFQGNISFDKSDMGIKRLTKSYNEATESQKLFAEGTSLTIEQARELSRDQNRIAASMKFMGKSMDEITAAQRVYANEYNNVASAYNRIDAAEKAVIKQRKEVVSATNYVTQADQRMAAALNVSNVGLDRASSDSLVKYETALRKSGVAQDVLTTKLATYKTQLSQVQAQEQKAREAHLARALPAQATDIVVSLWSGQNPLTVLLQQGGQVNDLFMQSGVAAENFSKTVREALSRMLPSLKTVAVGIGEVIVDGFMSLGRATTDFIGNTLGITKVLEAMNKGLTSVGWGVAEKGIQRLTTGFSILAGGVITGVAALLGSLAIGLKQVIAQENELNRAVALSGGAMGATADIANTYVARLGEITGNSTKANEAMVAMAKAGNITSSSVMMVGEAAITLNKAMGTPIEETVKQFDKLATAPGKTLIEIAKATGLISAETVELVLQYERAGESAKAAELAQKAYAAATKSAAASVKENYGTLTTFAMGVSTIFSKMWDSILGVGRSDNLDTRIDSLRQRIAENSKATPGLFLTKERIDQDTKDLNMQFYALVQQRQELMNIGKQKEQSVKSTKAIEESERLSLQYSSSIEKSKQEITKLDNQRKQWEKDGLLTEERKLLISKGIAVENKKINDELSKNKDKKTESFFDSSMKALRNNTVEAAVANDGLVESQVKLLQIIKDPAFAKMTEIQKIQIMQAGAAAIATEQQAEAVKQLEKAEDRLLKLLGKSEGIGRQYYADMENMERDAKLTGKTREEIEELTRAIFKTTPAWKSYEKAVDAVTAAVVKHNGASSDMMSEADALLANLELREQAIGKTKSEQDALYEAYRKNNKITEVRIKLSETLRKIEKDITAAQKDGLLPDQYKELTEAKVNAAAAAGKAIEAINKETSVKAREEADKEFAEFKSGISGSIVTALFEGGKEGSKKLRQVLVDTLRKKVTIVVDAVVNTLMGNVVGSLFGGSGGGAGGSAGGSILGTISNGFSALNGSIAGGFSNAFTSFASSSVGQSLGLSNSSAIMGNNPSAFVPPGGQLTSLGSGLGTAAGMLGSGLAGYGISGAISGGYTTGGNTVNVIAGITSAFLGPIAGVVGGLINRTFGRKLKDTGIQGTFGGEAGFEGEMYQFYKGGWLRSDKTKTSELDSGLQKMLSDSFKAMQVQTGTFATVLGLSTDKIAGFTTSIKVSLQGLKEEEIQGKIQEALATVNNELAQQVIGTWTTTTKEIQETIATGAHWDSGEDQWKTVTRTIEETTYTASEYAKEGEKAIDTLTRLAGSLSTVNNTFKNFGWSLYEVSLAGASASSKFVDLFGTMENFTQAASTYYENFYTEAERAANVTRDITEALAKFGLETPKTREGYRALVEQQQKLGESGAESVAVLLKLSGAFAEISQTTEEANQVISDSFARENEILRLTGQEVLAVSRERAKELAALDPANRALQERIYALQDEQSATEKAKAAAQDAAKAHEELIRVLTEIVKTALQILDNAIKKEKEAAKSTFDALMKDIDNRRNVTVKAFEAQRNMLTVAIEGASNLANLLKEEANRIRGYATGMKLASDPTDILGGALSAQARLRSGDTSNAVLEAATNIDPEMFATWADYATNFFATQGIISDFADKADRQVSEAVSQVSLLEHQLELTELQHQSDLEHYTKLEEAAKLSLEAQIAYYDSILEIANMQLEEALGTKLAVMTLGDAMSNFSGTIEKLSRATRNEVTSILPSLSGLPSFDVGTNYVPNNMIAQIHKGEAIIPAAYNPAASGSLASEELVNVLIEIKNVLVNTQNVTIDQKQSSDKLVRLIDSVTEGGQGMINAE